MGAVSGRPLRIQEAPSPPPVHAFEAADDRVHRIAARSAWCARPSRTEPARQDCQRSAMSLHAARYDGPQEGVRSSKPALFAVMVDRGDVAQASSLADAHPRPSMTAWRRIRQTPHRCCSPPLAPSLYITSTSPINVSRELIGGNSTFPARCRRSQPSYERCTANPAGYGLRHVADSPLPCPQPKKSVTKREDGAC